MKLKEIGKAIGARVVGDDNLEITRVNSIDLAAADELSFIANPKYKNFLATTKAGAVILQSEVSVATYSQLLHPNPHYAFAKALTLFYPKPGSELAAGIARTAQIADDAQIGKACHIGNFVEIASGAIIGNNSKIMAGTIVGKNCRIGDNTLICANVTIYDEIEIGSNCTIHSGSVIGADGFGYATEAGEHHKIYQVGTVKICDKVEIGANCCIDRATLGQTYIGAGCKIDNLVQIAHNVRLGRGCLIVAQVGISGSTKLGDYVVLAGQVGVVGHIEIGDQVMVGAQSGVSKSIAPKNIMAGSPVREIREYKRIEAHIHKLPGKMRKLKQLEDEIAELRAKDK